MIEDELFEKMSSRRGMASLLFGSNLSAKPKYSPDGKSLISYQGEDVYHIEEGTQEIGEGACRLGNAPKIYIPESVESIGANAFFFSDITDIVIPSAVKRIGSHAFQDCEKLENVEILSNSIEAVEDYTFNRCPFKIMVVPEGVKEIGKYAFEGCKGLSELYLPSTLQTLGYQAFAGCVNLKDIICYSVIPPRFPENKFGDNSCFAGIKQLPTLHVPKDFVSLYKANSTWNKFPILPME